MTRCSGHDFRAEGVKYFFRNMHFVAEVKCQGDLMEGPSTTGKCGETKEVEARATIHKEGSSVSQSEFEDVLDYIVNNTREKYEAVDDSAFTSFSYDLNPNGNNNFLLAAEGKVEVDGQVYSVAFS